MTATEKQIEANRLNAQKSTGPKTDAGKIKSSQNAVKHGMYSHRVLIDSPQFTEDSEEYAAMIESLYEELQPRSAFQESLVHTIADCLWRSQRAVFAETALIQSRLADVDQSVHTQWLIQRSFPKGHLQSDSLDDPENCRRYRDNLIGECCIPYPKACQNIMRYEASLDRRLHRAYKLLETLQSRLALAGNAPDGTRRAGLSQTCHRGMSEDRHALRDNTEPSINCGVGCPHPTPPTVDSAVQNEQTKPFDQSPILPPLSRGDRGVCSDESACTLRDNTEPSINCGVGCPHPTPPTVNAAEQNEQTNPFSSHDNNLSSGSNIMSHPELVEASGSARGGSAGGIGKTSKRTHLNQTAAVAEK